MCGINGFNWRDPKAIARMNQMTAHRGPDAHGVYEDDDVTLGHNRLSIIDLTARGNQPMSTEDGLLTIVFNGEIYNYQEIRAELERKGHRFRTTTDTEVILRGYKEYSTNILERMNGDFAFCIYDKQRRLLFLARDRIGVKPFFYYHRDGRFIFSSDIKPVFSHLSVEQAGLDDQEMMNYLTYRRTRSQTLFRGIKICPPGHYLLFHLDTKRLVEKSYYDLFEKLGEPLGGDLDSTFKSIISRSVEFRMISDAKLGVVCSGGLDSSLVTALCAERNRKIEVFFVDVREPGFSELRYVQAVVRRYGLKLHVEPLTREAFIRHLVDAVYYGEVPLTHPNSIGIYLVSRKARERGVKVLLTGEGSDELFGGYVDRYVYVPIIRRLARFFWRQRASRLLSLALIGAPLRLSSLQSVKLCSLDDAYATWRLRGTGREEREQAMLLDFYDYLQPILIRQDKMSMWASVESRVPFLDHELVEFGINLPLKQKIAGLSTKRIVRRLGRKLLPRSVLRRKKVGFALPVNRWLRVDGNFFDGGFLASHYGVPTTFLESLCVEEDFRWQLVNLEIWGRLFILAQPRQRVAALLRRCCGADSRASV